MAIVSDVFIANLALSRLGTRTTIESLTERSAEAIAVDLWYNLTRELLLERHDWGFARTREDLATDDELAPCKEWAYSYIYPADCLKARYIEREKYASNYDYIRPQCKVPSQDQIPYQIGRSPDGQHRTVLTNKADATLVYTLDLVDPTRFSKSFVMLFATQLAAAIAFQITNKVSVEERMLGIAERMFLQVAASDANEEAPEEEPDAPWILGRD